MTDAFGKAITNEKGDAATEPPAVSEQGRQPSSPHAYIHTSLSAYTHTHTLSLCVCLSLSLSLSLSLTYICDLSV